MVRHVGDLCWVPDAKRAFVPGKVIELLSDGKLQVEVETADHSTPSSTGLSKPSTQAQEVDKKDLCERTPGGTCLADLDDLEFLNMAEVLNSIDFLFQLERPSIGRNVIYSCVGPVLVAMNPFQELPLYGADWIKKYHNASRNPIESKKLGPHCYRTAEESYQGLRLQRVQSVVICGESGAGKTVTNRKMLAYLCEVAKSESPKKVAVNPVQITTANELLETFGNARTTRNDNSSRFGKLTSLYFDPQNGYQVTGCGVTHYLLERSRIVGAPLDERNYHIFYQLLHSEYASKYGLTPDAGAYHYTRQGANIPTPEGFGGETFKDLLESMRTAGFDAAAQEHIWQIVSAVLHLGNVKFEGDQDHSELDQSASEPLATSCRLLGVDEKQLCDALKTQIRNVPGQKIVTAVGVQKAEAQRDALAKMLYSLIFDYIVRSIDGMLMSRCERGVDEGAATIGLLDIFGFEDMQINGFEQLFINFTNERIQHLFNTIMFDREKQVYEAEGISADFLHTPQNIECVNLFLGKPRVPGIVGLLSSQCSTGYEDEKVDGEKFVNVLKTSPSIADNKEFFKVCTPSEVNALMRRKGLKEKGGTGKLNFKECFEIKHYAGDITYTVQDFIPKSRDSLLPHLSAIMTKSSKAEVANMFAEDDCGEDNKKTPTVGEKFKVQLEKLAATLEAGETLFVRCIKSNQAKRPRYIDRPIVLDQLIRGGVVAALEMRASGFPDRMTYLAFCSEFGLLEGGKQEKETKSRCKRILSNLISEEDAYVCGNEKVFMKTGVLGFLRAAARFKTAVYARRLHKKLRGARVRKVGKAWERIENAAALAKQQSLEDIKLVKEALQKGRDTVGPIWAAVQEAKKAHGNDLDAMVNALQPYEHALKTLQNDSVLVSEVVEKFSARKREAEETFSLRIRGVVNSLVDQLSEIEAVEKDIADCEDIANKEELESCRLACNKARQRIEELRTKELPAIKQEGPSGVNLEPDGEDADRTRRIAASTCQRVDAALAEIEGLVHAAKADGVAVLRVRREFAAAVAEVESDLEASRNQMDAIEGKAQQCIQEGLEDVVDKIAVAENLEDELRTLLLDARSPETYRAKALAFTAAVKVAGEAVEKAAEELARRERERSRRRQLHQILDVADADVTRGLDTISKQRVPGAKVLQDAGVLHELAREVPALRADANSDLQEWEARVESLQQKVLSTLQALEEHLEEDSKERRKTFEAKAGVFGKTVGAKAPRESLARDRSATTGFPNADYDFQSFIEDEKLEKHQALLMQLESTIKALKDAGVQRSDINKCAKRFIDNSYSLSTVVSCVKSAFKPQGRPAAKTEADQQDGTQSWP